ncbi:Putative calcium-binding mitochondrial carrier F55A11.4 [Toxocara canis]|uniref:Putative calcium-binding mitochondrial carrier F55A11.4 n=1 Tax=Toxocara canis TaxID=6265 RepID=A0A0B2W121_TOXCA|nr:Putative calcium-binding mitochondrial carrier F55A11.4 [Toxocara canis]
MSVFHHATPDSRQRHEEPFDSASKLPSGIQKSGGDSMPVNAEDKANAMPSTSEKHSVTGMKLFPVDEPVDRPEVGAHIKHVTPLLKPSAKSNAPLIQGSVRKETAIATHANLHGLSAEKEMRLRELYERLDMDNDGTIDIRDLTMALEHEMPHIPTVLAPVGFKSTFASF